MKIKVLALIFYLMSLSSCYAARVDGPYEGKILDEDTGKPLAGVVVLGTWSREIPSPGGAVSSYYDAQETVTDRNGDFTIKGLGLLVMSNVVPMDVLIFKAGYTYFGVIPWEGLVNTVRLENNRAIIRLKKLTMQERRQSIPPLPPGEAPLSKVILMLKEFNKNSSDLRLHPIESWGGEKI